jgi:hypothetical protein
VLVFKEMRKLEKGADGVQQFYHTLYPTCTYQLLHIHILFLQQRQPLLSPERMYELCGKSEDGSTILWNITKCAAQGSTSRHLPVQFSSTVM